MLFCGEVLETPTMEAAEIRAIAEGTVNAIRTHPRVAPNVPIIVAVEACAGDSNFIGDIFFELGVLVMREVGRGRYGVPKNQRITRDLVVTMETMLSMPGLVVIPTDAVPFSTEYAKKRKTMFDFRNALAAQFANFRLDQTTGKMNGKGNGGNDDLLITFMMALYWMTRFCQSEDDEYEMFRRLHGEHIWDFSHPGAIVNSIVNSQSAPATPVRDGRVRAPPRVK